MPIRSPKIGSALFIGVLALVVLAACAAPAAPPAAPTVTPPAPTTAPTTAPTQPPPTTAPTIAPTTAPTTAPAAGAPEAVLAKQAQGGFVSSFGWSGNNQTLTAQVEGSIVQYNAADLTATNAVSTTFAAQVFALSPDGSQVVGLAQDQSVQLWSAADGKPIVTLENAALPLGATFTPDGSMVATYSGDKIEIQLWDAKTGKAVKTLSGFQTAAPVYSAVFAPNNQTMAWVSRGTVQFMDVESGTLGATLQFEDFVGAAQFTPDSQSFVTVSAGTVNNQSAGLVQVWNAADGKMQQELTNPEFFNGLSVSPTGTYLATATGNTLMTWDWQAGGEAKSATAPGQIAVLDFSNDGKLLATGDQDGNIVTWTVE